MEIIEISPTWQEGRIEEIGRGRTTDTLMISNRKPYLWILSLFNGYRQLGTYKILKPHDYHQGENVLIRKALIKKKILGLIPHQTKDIYNLKKDTENPR